MSMDSIAYLAAALLAYSGIFFGYLLLLIAPEEQKPLRRPLTLLRALSFLGAIVICAWTSVTALKVVLLVIAAIFIFFLPDTHPKIKTGLNMVISFLLGLVFALSTIHIAAFIGVFVCVVLYGMGTGVMNCRKSPRTLLPTALLHLPFLLGASAYWL